MRRLLHVGIRRSAVGEDSARVTVHERQQYALAGDLTFCMEDNDYVFERTEGGWRFVRRVFLGHADGGDMCGRPCSPRTISHSIPPGR